MTRKPIRIVLARRSDHMLRLTVAVLRQTPSGVVEWITDEFERMSEQQFLAAYHVEHEFDIPEVHVHEQECSVY